MSPRSTTCSSAEILQEINNIKVTIHLGALLVLRLKATLRKWILFLPVEETENLNQGSGNITVMMSYLQEGNLLHKVDCRDYRTVLRKDLTNSDVGKIGRIVLPKREAEPNLPVLRKRDGLILVMDDLILPAIWKFKYRFWPNNKSRMYILETTGEFVKRHNLQAGDILMIYKNKKTGKYVVRGVKATEHNADMEVLECECLKRGNSSEECGFFVSPIKNT
ncbi:hypothetical protein ACP70R_030427 [Stipagrostis hirtigluma subsp. patula]